MAKISLVLVFSLLVALPFRSVLSQDDSWKDLLGQGSFSQDTLDEAKKALGGSGIGIGIGEATGDASFFDDGEEGSSLADWIDEDSEAVGRTASAPTKSIESPIGAPEDLPTDEVYDDEDGSPAEAPYSLEENSPESSPTEAPEQAPTYAPTNAPFEASVNAPTQTPQVSPTNAPTEAPELAPTNAPEEGNAPTEAPEGAPTESPEGEPDDDDDDSEGASPTEAPEGEPSDQD